MSAQGTETAPDVELLLFEIGGTVYGADASQVLRIDRVGEGAIRLDVLGPLARGARVLVCPGPDGERQLAVDSILGVRTVEADSLRRLPPATATPPFAIGVWLDGERSVLLLDLTETLKVQGRQ